MKKIILTLIFLLNMSLNIPLTEANDLLRFPVYDMVETNFDIMYELKSSKSFDRIILDCQSFMHGLHFYTKEDEGKWNSFFRFYLESKECDHIFNFIRESLVDKQHVCVEINVYSGEYDLSQHYKDCN